MGKLEKLTLGMSAREWELISIESLQWCANNAVYFLGLIGAATYDLAGGAFLVAGITLVKNLCMSLGNVLAGPAIDRMGPRRVTLVTIGASVVASLMVGILPLTVGLLFFAAVFLGLMGGFINTCTHAYPSYIQPDDQARQRLNGYLVLFGNIAFTLGPIVGGVLVAVLPTNSVFLFMTVLMVLAFGVTLPCHELVRPPAEEVEQVGVVSGMVEGFRTTFHDQALRIIFLAGFFGFFAFGAFDSLESIFYRDVLRVDIEWLGWLSAEVGITSTIGSWIVTRLPSHSVNLGTLLASLSVVGVGSIIYVCTGNLLVAIVGQAINGFGWGFLEPVQMTLVQRDTPLDKLGRVMGFVRFGHMFAGVFPLLIAPFLAEVVGAQGVLLGASCVVAFVGFLFVALRTIRLRAGAHGWE